MQIAKSPSSLRTAAQSAIYGSLDRFDRRPESLPRLDDHPVPSNHHPVWQSAISVAVAQSTPSLSERITNSSDFVQKGESIVGW